ncbi:UDP-glycosyltransferase 91C1 [Morella rubra]|uniref:UDP-glycosyltransferase 91C1 n=1 Tax=Morella rubra TaxID=262757 RepID=A0A6A1UTZ4_9ROSI|nr:UDP-glycosyltransferase 91C1 [Morella rubra]
MENGGVLHVAVFPWLAMGHLIPFVHLSKCLARKGHRVSFISTPRNISRLPRIPPNLSPLINLVSLPLPHVDGLPDHAESSADVPYHKQRLLKRAFDLLKPQLTAVLEASRPDWIIYDYASHWLPPLATQLGVSRAFFSLFTAACLSFIGPPAVLIDGDSRSTAEDFTVIPKWVPFHSNVAYRIHEVSRYVDAVSAIGPEISDSTRFGITAAESDVVAIRTSAELEPEWLNLLVDLYQKPVVPVGFLPPVMEDEEREEGDEKWSDIREWLDKQRRNSVVYVATGTEATLTPQELNELALGLEQSGLPFVWVLRNPPWSTLAEVETLPTGFEERVKGRGMVYLGWAPQVKILRHESIGGFLTHCGWNSVTEGLGYGRVLILFPLLNDQGLNSRLLQGKKLGVEITRNERDGSFTRDSVAESLRLAMVDDSGQSLRATAKEMKVLFGDENKNDQLVDGFIHFLETNRLSKEMRVRTCSSVE